MVNYLKKIVPLVFDKWLFVYLFCAYILLTVVLTLTHEGGHYLVARCLGYKASINYGETKWSIADTNYIKEWNDLKEVWLKDSGQIRRKEDFPGKKEYETKRDQFYEKYYTGEYFGDDYLITWGGPIETMLTGTIGLFLLFFYRGRFNSVEKLSFKQWFTVFIALFWVRQPVNMIIWLFVRLIIGKVHSYMDELYLAGHSNLPNGFIAIGTGIFGLLVMATVFFYFIPPKQRLTFMVGSLIGGTAGYILWLIELGPKIMP